MDAGRCAGIFAEWPTEWIAVSNPSAGNQRLCNIYAECMYMHTYALCGCTRHLRTCRYAAILVNRPSGISQAAAIAANRTQGVNKVKFCLTGIWVQLHTLLCQPWNQSAFNLLFKVFCTSKLHSTDVSGKMCQLKEVTFDFVLNKLALVSVQGNRLSFPADFIFLVSHCNPLPSPLALSACSLPSLSFLSVLYCPLEGHMKSHWFSQ